MIAMAAKRSRERRAAAQSSHLTMSSRALANTLTRGELAEVLTLFHACLVCPSDREFSLLLRRLSSFLAFEFLLYAYMRSRYLRRQPVVLVNETNPKAWMKEYEANNFLEHDPVRIELEARLAAKQTHGVIVWDAYERNLSAMEKHVIQRRKSYGLHHGFSVYCNSQKQDSVFLVSFASATKLPAEHSQLIAQLVVPHLNRCRKRLNLSSRVSKLTKREQAVANWLIEGKTNWEIAQILAVTESTVKYHVANILAKLQANSRQSAVAILISERYLA